MWNRMALVRVGLSYFQAKPSLVCMPQLFSNLVIIYLLPYEDGTECSETSAYKIQTPGNYPEENIQHTELGKSLISRKLRCLRFLQSRKLRRDTHTRIHWASGTRRKLVVTVLVHTDYGLHTDVNKTSSDMNKTRRLRICTFIVRKSEYSTKVTTPGFISCAITCELKNNKYVHVF